MAAMQHGLIGEIEVASSQGYGHRFEKHSHDEFVISANLFGNEQVWLDGRSFSAGAGTLTTYNPGQIQGGGVPEDQPWHFVSLYVTADLLSHSLGLAHVEFARAATYLPGLTQRMAQVVDGSLADDCFLRERGEERLILLLGDIVQASGMRLPMEARLARGAVLQLQELLAAQLDAAPNLEQMATPLGLSKFQLLRAFQQDTGMSPRQWAMQLRTRRAQGLLRAGLAVTEVAHTLGFADQSHLTRHFRSAYGLPPGQYQRAVRR